MKLYRTLILSSVLALSANAALAGDAQDTRRIQNSIYEVIRGESGQNFLQEGRASAVEAPPARVNRNADAQVKEPIQFSIATAN